MSPQLDKLANASRHRVLKVTFDGRSAIWWFLSSLFLFALAFFVAGYRNCGVPDFVIDITLLLTSLYWRLILGIVLAALVIGGLMRTPKRTLALAVFCFGIVLAIVVPIIAVPYQGGCTNI
jgi:peptidoglycan/LPS O-acetylase OafA/YrhL